MIVFRSLIAHNNIPKPSFYSGPHLKAVTNEMPHVNVTGFIDVCNIIHLPSISKTNNIFINSVSSFQQTTVKALQF